MSTSPESTKFDPYYKWLGIPKREQPPNHYRLLGIKLFEVDGQVIEAAAQRQAAFIHGCGEKKFSDLAQKLIADVAAARACLLDPAAKAQYDETLKQQQPRAAGKAPRQSRYDSLQVNDVDKGVPGLAAEPGSAASQPPEPAAAAEPEPESADMGLIPLDDEPPKAAKAPAPAPPPVRAGKTPAKPAEEAVVDLGDEDLVQATKPAPLPPLPAAKAQSDESHDVSSATVIKLVVAGCVVAGGITAGLLWWMSSNSSKETAASTSTPAAVSPTPQAQKPSTPAGAQAVAANPAAAGNPAAATPAPAGQNPAPPAAPANITFLGTSWNWQSPKGNSVIKFDTMGLARIVGTDYFGGWEQTGAGQIRVRFARDFYDMVASADGKSLDGKTAEGIVAHATLTDASSGATPAATAAPAQPTAPAPGQPTATATPGQQDSRTDDSQSAAPASAAAKAPTKGAPPVAQGPWMMPSPAGPPMMLSFGNDGVANLSSVTGGRAPQASWALGGNDAGFELHIGKDVYEMTLGPDGRSISGKSATGKTITASLLNGGGPPAGYGGTPPGVVPPPAAVMGPPPGVAGPPPGVGVPPGVRTGPGGRTRTPGARQMGPTAPGTVSPAAPVAAAPLPGDDNSADANDAVISDWTFPLRNVQSFRAAWVKGDDGATINYDGDTRIATIDGGGDLGGLQYKKPWKEVVMTLHAETITGKLEIQVNDTTLKFGTATVVIRKPATISITYDPTTFKLIATVANRQVATATTLSDTFTQSLTCRLRIDSGKATMTLQNLKVR